jgi:serine/threonine protein kinase
VTATRLEFEDIQHKAGERFGNYVLDKPMGAGGFAEVWQANDESANRRVALKIFFDRVTHDATVWKAIREEPKKQPEHERIVPIYHCHLDSDNQPGPYYVVMKLMQGGTLEEMLHKRGKLPPADAVRIIRDVLAGLDYAHSKGIIHRDIKPSNILFDANGRAALADFGIAKDLNKTGNSSVFGSVVGTATYMSHEQGEGRLVTKATDIYSLGTVLYEMLAGKVPFDGPSDTGIIVARAKSDPAPLRPGVPDVSERLEKVVMTCLDRNLEFRYADCNALSRALDWATEPASGPVVPPPAPTPSTVPKKKSKIMGRVVLPGLAALLLSGFAFWQIHRTDPLDELKKVHWNSVHYNDNRFADCQGYEPCIGRKLQAERLLKLADWKTVPAGSELLADCMGYQPCEDRKNVVLSTASAAPNKAKVPPDSAHKVKRSLGGNDTSPDDGTPDGGGKSQIYQQAKKPAQN